jgi:hypothetical protein
MGVSAASNPKPNPKEVPGLEKEKRGEAEAGPVEVVLVVLVASESSIASAGRRWNLLRRGGAGQR